MQQEASKLRILHVLSQVQLTGAEVYSIALAEAHIAAGNEVFIISDKLHKSTTAQYFSQPIDKRTYKQRLRNIRFIKNIIKTHKIDVVHAHSRAASWVANIAVMFTKVPLISTIHGRQHLHASVSLFNIYGNKLIAVCDNLKTHLINEVKISPNHVSTISNGFDFKAINARRNDNTGTKEGTVISIIGRTSSKKGDRTIELLQHIFPDLLEQHSQFIIKIIGGELKHFSANGQQQLVFLQAKYPARIQFVGHVNDVPHWIQNSDLVVGSGRVAIETLALNKPLLAIGEGCTHGLVSELNIDQAKASNFGDILPTQHTPSLDYTFLKNELNQFLKTNSPKAPNLIHHLQDYDINTIADEVLELYKSERMKKIYPKFVPILMYHKVPDAPIDSVHKIFVTKINFEKHLKFFKSRNLSSITFQDYLAVRNGLISIDSLPKNPIIITFDDGYKDNLYNALPLMNQYNFKGVLYLLGDKDLLANNWDESSETYTSELLTIEEKSKFVSAGWEIGAHSMTHPHLTNLDSAEVKYEILESKNRLENDLGIKISSFAYPYGSINQEVKSAFKLSGIAFGIATDTGGMTIEDDLQQVFRINMFPNESVISLYKKTSSWYRRYYRWRREK